MSLYNVYSETEDSGSVIGRPGTLLARIVALSALLLLVSQIAFAWNSLKGFEQVLKPQLERKAEVVARAVGNLIEFAVSNLEIPPERLVGVESYFHDVKATNEEIEFIVLADEAGNVLFANGITMAELEGSGMTDAKSDRSVMESAGLITASFSISMNERVRATLHVGVSGEYVSNRLSSIYFDVITVIVISWLVTIEFMVFFMNTQITTPLRSISMALAYGKKGVFSNQLAVRTRDEVGRVISGLNSLLRTLQQRYEDFSFEVREIGNAQLDGKVADKVHSIRLKVDKRFRFTGGKDIRPTSSIQIRIPLFLLMFSEELSRSFLPLFVDRLAPVDSSFSNEFLVGLPITLFMLAAAAFTPIGGAMADYVGARRVFLIGAITAAVGYGGTFLTSGYYDFIFWRVLSGIGYGLIFIAAQAWVMKNTRSGQRAKGMSVFVGAVFVGMICGPPIGGIIAGRLGYEAAFLLSAGLALVSGLIVYTTLEDFQVRHKSTRAWFDLTSWRILILDPRFIAVSFFAAVPGKFVTTGFFFFLVPLRLAELGNSQSVIGWIMMLYGVATITCLPLASWLADHTGKYSVSVATGVGLTGLGCLANIPAIGFLDGTLAIGISIFTLGIGHALSLTSQLAIVQDVADSHRGVLGQASAVSAYRLVERLGLVLGPIIAAPLAFSFGYQGAIVGIGVITVAFVALYLVTMRFAERASPLVGGRAS